MVRRSPSGRSSCSWQEGRTHLLVNALSVSGEILSGQIGLIRGGGASISPTTASPEARGKLRAHGIKRTTSAPQTEQDSGGLERHDRQDWSQRYPRARFRRSPRPRVTPVPDPWEHAPA